MPSTAASVNVSYAHLSDEDILPRVLNGDIEAYEGIMRHHNQRLFRVARSIVTDDAEAMDVVQESFVQAYQKLGELREAGALPTWLARITRNTALMRLRKSRRMQYMDEPDFENVMNLSSAVKRPEQPDAKLANVQLRRLLESCIDELPDAFRAVFMLRAIEHCSIVDTAEILEIKEATVKTRFHRARLLLQKRLLEYSEADGVSVHEFAGHRCDRIVQNVLQELRANGDKPTPSGA